MAIASIVYYKYKYCNVDIIVSSNIKLYNNTIFEDECNDSDKNEFKVVCFIVLTENCPFLVLKMRTIDVHIWF